MAVSVDGTSYAVFYSGNKAGPHTFAFTNSAGDLLTVGVSMREGGKSITSATYAGATMTLTDNISSNFFQLFTKASPNTGSNNVSLTFSAYGACAGSVCSFSGTDAAGTPMGTPVQAFQGSVSSLATASITCPANGLIMAVYYSQYGTSSSAQSGSTVVVSGNSNTKTYGTMTRDTTGTIGYNNSDSTTLYIIGVPLNPAAAGAFVAAPHKTITGIASRRSNEY